MIVGSALAKILILPNSSILKAIEILNLSQLKIVLVVDSNNHLIGTITDGDIRRGLLEGIQISDPVERVLNHQPLVITRNLVDERTKRLAKSSRVNFVPIVDENRKLIGLQDIQEIYKIGKRKNTMVIMAGGKGTRLMPRTEFTPKPMLKMAGKPILEHIIERARASGFQNLVLAVHHLGNQIEEYFGDGRNFGVRITYTHEDKPLGTAGALSLLDPVPSESVLVTNGDVLTDVDYGNIVDFHRDNEAIGTMAVQLNEWKNPYGVVTLNGVEITEFVEKPVLRQYVNAGVYVLEPKALELIRKSIYVDMPSLFDTLLGRELKVIAYPIQERWIDVGTPKDFNKGGKEFFQNERQKG